MSGSPAIKGWCPGAHRPMMSGDGFVVRVRPWLGQINVHQALGLADLAQDFGSGVIDLTSRANLQIRGVQEADFPALLAGLQALDLLDDTPATEHLRNVVVDPFRATNETFDQGKIAGLLIAGLRSPSFLPLPGKFGFVVDCGARRQLAHVSGDIRIERSRDRLLVRAQGLETGVCVTDAEAAVDVALYIARWFLQSGGVGADGRGRMARHLQAGAVMPSVLTGDGLPNACAAEQGPGFAANGVCVGFAFGQMTSAALRHIAGAMQPAGVLRVTPFRMVFVPGLTATELTNHDDIILDQNNPLRRIIACPGAPFCPQASVETRSLGRALAPLLAPDDELHLSGCAKGCARPAPCALTLTGRAGAFDLVRRGAPWDEADHTGLAPNDIKNMLEH